MPCGSPEGVTPNDPGDVDTGGNGMQNFPLFTSVTTGATTHVQGVLHSKASTVYDLDFYANTCSNFPREFLEGHTWIGTTQVTTDGNGDATFDETFPVATAATTQDQRDGDRPARATPPSSRRDSRSRRRPRPARRRRAARPHDQGHGLRRRGHRDGRRQPATNSTSSSADARTITAKTPALSAGVANDIAVTNTDGTIGRVPKGYVSDFLDVPPRGPSTRSSTTLVSNGITAGIGGGNYGVNDPTVRQQMAVFLLKAQARPLLHAAAVRGNVHRRAVHLRVRALDRGRSRREGITTGCGGSNYCPLNPVRRDQMAVFLLKTKYGSSYVPPACDGDFRRRALFVAVRPLDRGARGRADHQGLRRQQLLPDQPQHSRPDGGVHRQDVQPPITRAGRVRPGSR